MENSFGKLILIQAGGPEQEFELAKTSISLGRATTNDITLNDVKISRNHARIDCEPAGVSISDLGSSNGTLLNGVRVSKSELSPGDEITLGNLVLRYEEERAADMVEMTMIDSESDLELSLDREFLPVSLNETGIPRLVVFTPDRTWEVSLDDVDSLSIGRTDENQLAIPLQKVSRHHALVARKGMIYTLRDLGSTNGTWLKGERMDEVILQDGDLFRIGSAQILYKSGFEAAELTMADQPLTLEQPRRPVVFVPGLMGSQLWQGNVRVWPNVKLLLKQPEVFQYPSSLEARGVVNEIVIVPGLLKQDQYNRLGDYLVEELHYTRGVDFFEFAYDWRQDVRISSRQLAEQIEAWKINRPITIIAHSLGTLVTRYFVERLGGKKKVERILLMGGPHRGTPKILGSLLVAPEVLPFGLMGDRLRQIVVSFPTSYQILPLYACGKDQQGRDINFFEDDSWVPEAQRPHWRMAREFRKELGTRSSVPAVSIFGYGIKTISTFSVERDPTGLILKASYKEEPRGDSSIPEQSAVLDGSEIHPVQQYHGSLFVDNDVKMRLKLELTRQPT
jgi:pSer/pThr/pTyr-binding forkhead associated (FHA) protein